MQHDRPRWRLHISTLMMLILVLGLALALVIERGNHERELQAIRASTEVERAESKRLLMKYQMAVYAYEQAQARAEWEARSRRASGDAPGRTVAEGKR